MTPDTSKLLLEIIEHTAIITINNPAANTWDEESLPALQEIIQQLNQCAEIYALVITGQGEKFFSVCFNILNCFFLFLIFSILFILRFKITFNLESR